MKKDMIFAPLMLAIAALLFLYDLIGDPVHIAASVAGIMVLAVYTAATKKTWRFPALEIGMRAFYGVALISGIVIMNVDTVPALQIAHKVFAGLFVALLIALFIHKLIVSRKAND